MQHCVSEVKSLYSTQALLFSLRHLPLRKYRDEHDQMKD
jgi:hypothetical protein